MTPIFATSTYAQPEFGVSTGYEYARVSNPTRTALEANLAALEGGAHAVCFASGMAAVSALMGLFSSGDHIVVSDNVYGGVYRAFETIFRNYGLAFTWVDTSDLGALEAAIRPETKLVYVETPTNPVMQVTDIAGASAAAHRRGVPLLVDNTFMTPVFQRPLELGADLVLHSTTKYLNGHSDSLGGVLITNDAATAERLRFIHKTTGALLSPFECFLVLRGTKTLAVRMRQHEQNGRAVVSFLEGQKAVRRIYYPGLAGHPGHKIHARQASGFGAMVAFDVGSLEAARRFLNALQLFTLAESLGGVESLACHPATMTHAAVPKEKRDALGVTEGLVRLSVGIEGAEDLLADLAGAFKATE
jgi:cystathionine beta-lyase/cystathionine gamma-synthase